jgi:phosphopantetheinyl transferase (holo-ACP synthase)
MGVRIGMDLVDIGEAVAKVLAPAEGDALPFSQIVLKAQAGVVDVHLEGEAAELAHRRGVTSVTVSVACAGESAVATALARTSNPTAGNR